MSSVEFGLRPRGRIDRSTSPSFMCLTGLRASTDRFNRRRHSDRGLDSRVIPAGFFPANEFFFIIITGGPAFLSSFF